MSKKKQRQTIQRQIESLQGFIWNDTLSCAYDSVWVILLAIYKTDRQRWNSDIRDQNRCLSLFTEYMEQVNGNEITLEEARNQLRDYLHSLDPLAFPVQATLGGTGIDNVCDKTLIPSVDTVTWTLFCVACERHTNRTRTVSGMWDCTRLKWNQSRYKSGSPRYASIQKWLPVVLHEPVHRRCQHCDSKLERHYVYDTLPSFLVFNVYESTAKLEQFVEVQDQQYRLCGVVYFGNFHFTSRVITAAGDVLFYDGMVDDGNCSYDGNLRSMTVTSLHETRGRAMSIAIYYKVVAE